MRLGMEGLSPPADAGSVGGRDGQGSEGGGDHPAFSLPPALIIPQCLWVAEPAGSQPMPRAQEYSPQMSACL